MPSRQQPCRTVKDYVFVLFKKLGQEGIDVDEVQLSDIQPLFKKLGSEATANKLYMYRFMFKYPKRFEQMRKTANELRRAATVERPKKRVKNK